MSKDTRQMTLDFETRSSLPLGYEGKTNTVIVLAGGDYLHQHDPHPEKLGVEVHRLIEQMHHFIDMCTQDSYPLNTGRLRPADGAQCAFFEEPVNKQMMAYIGGLDTAIGDATLYGVIDYGRIEERVVAHKLTNPLDRYNRETIALDKAVARDLTKKSDALIMGAMYGRGPKDWEQRSKKRRHK